MNGFVLHIRLRGQAWRLALARHMAWWRVRRDAWWFRRNRVDYYSYLAALLTHGKGRVALREVFSNDAIRYGEWTARGRLSAQWALGCGRHGGNLAALWAGVAPAQECLLLATAQSAGVTGLTQALEDLAQACALSRRATRIWASALFTALMACVVLLTTLWAVPIFTVPRLMQAFGTLPPDYYGSLTRALLGLAQVLPWAGPLVVTIAAIGAFGLWRSLASWRGALRARLDSFGPWRLYRDIQAIRFLALLAVLVRQQGNLDTRLRAALRAQRQYARPWLAWHLDVMLMHVDRGDVGPGTFATGLFDQSLWWFMSDMMVAHGVEGGLAQARIRVEAHWLPHVIRQAAIWRWALLLLAVLGMLLLAFWHYGVIDELRRGLTGFYASH